MHHHRLRVLAATALLLGGCASDSKFIIAGRAPDPKVLEADGSECRSAGPALVGFLDGALIGAAGGARVGVSSGTTGEGAIIGAAFGGLIGLAAGAVSSISGDGYDRCMAQKGYQRVETAAVETAKVETAAPVVVIPRQMSNEPAR